MEALGLTGQEVYHVEGLRDALQPGQEVTVRAEGDGGPKAFRVEVRIDSPVEVEYYRQGGILHYVLRNLLRDAP